MELAAPARASEALPACFRRWRMICLTENPIRWFLASVFLTALERDLTFHPTKLFKLCQISRLTTMMSSCVTEVPSFGLQATMMDGPVTWCKKSALPLDVPLEVRQAPQHLRLMTLRLVVQQAQTRLPGRPPSLLSALRLTTQRAPAPLTELQPCRHSLLPSTLVAPGQPIPLLLRLAALQFRRISCLQAAGRLRTSSVRSVRAGTTRGGRVTLTYATAAATRHLRPLLLLLLLLRRTFRPRRQTQTARLILVAAPRPTPVPTGCAAANGVTVDQQMDTAEIVARVEIAGPRETNKAITH